ncbi:MAG: MFS transporter [Rhizobiaceae bacterium]|nr:MFS transporter [Rhizobiaceae bacterium]
MMANSTSNTVSPPRFHYAWVIVAITFLVSVLNAGMLSISGILALPLQQHFGWEASDVSSAFGIRLALFGLLGPFSAAMMNRYGVRRMVAIALMIILAGLVGTYFMSTTAELFVFWGLFTGAGIGLIALVLGATVATRWFVARRGLVTGLLTASNATGQLVFLPLLASITQNYGWQVTIASAGGAVLVCLLLVLVFMRSFPADVGLSAYGDAANETSQPIKHKESIWALLATPLVVLKEAAEVPVFWALFFTFFICGASTNGLVQTHFIPLCGDYGIVPVEAAGILAMMGIFDLFGTVGSGWLSDRFDSRWLLFWYYGLRGLSLVFLPATDFSILGISVFAIFYGLDWIATVPPTLKITIDRFGGDKTPIVFGWIFAGHQIGAAAAAYGAGLSRTELGSYLPAFFVSGVLCFIAALLIVAVRKHGRTSPQPA